jgi:hypothetical protein
MSGPWRTGSECSDPLTSRNNLAGAYESAGRLDEAIGLSGQVLADCERLLSPGNPLTGTVRANLARARPPGGRKRR